MQFVGHTAWEQLPEGADALFAQAARDSVFLSRQWFECLSHTALEHDHSLLLACVVDDDRLLAILPLMQSRGSATGYALRHGYTPVYSLLITDEDRPRVVDCLVRGLQAVGINSLLLEPVDADDRGLDALRQALEAAGYHCAHRFRSYNWIHRLQGQSYAAYMAERPARLRNTITRKQRRLAREHGYRIRLLTGEEVPQGMVDYHRVYHASWKQNEPHNTAFQDCFIAAFSRAGWTRLAILYVGDQPVAAQLWFVHHGRASIYRLAYDEAWRAYSTGSILTDFLMQYVIDTDRVDEIDFLTGNDSYKQDWMTERRERLLLSCIRATPAPGRVGRIADALMRRLKDRSS